MSSQPGRAPPSLDELASSFRWFAANSYGGSSPIYQSVIEAVADDQELLEVVAAAPDDARHPGVLLGAVKFLLASGVEHPLAENYTALRNEGVADTFRSFVLTHRTEILDIMRFRRIQTNEIARAAVLAPVVRDVQRRIGRPLALIDVGTSAGINLLLDKVHVDYGHSHLGPADCALRLVCRALDAGPPRGPDLDVRWRVGLDRDPVDLTDPDDRRWLEACIWPEDTDRAERLATVAEIQVSDPPRLVRGDAVEALEPLIAEAPDDLMLVVMTSWAAVYLSGGQRGEFERTMAAADRPIAWVSAEFPDVVRGIDPRHPPKSDEVDLSKIAIVWFPGGGRPEQREFVGWSHNHGVWLDWPLDDEGVNSENRSSAPCLDSRLP